MVLELPQDIDRQDPRQIKLFIQPHFGNLIDYMCVVTTLDPKAVEG